MESAPTDDASTIAGAPGRAWRPAFVRTDALPGRYDWAELLGFVLVFALSVFTPATDAAGLPNAPLQETLERATGGGVCLWRRAFGIECGGCGLTRGFVQLGHGHPLAAIALNPLTPVIFAWCLWRLAELGAFVLLRRRLSHGIPVAWVWRGYGAFFFGFAILSAYRLVLGLTGP
jgi:hypothetical protein